MHVYIRNNIKLIGEMDLAFNPNLAFAKGINNMHPKNVSIYSTKKQDQKTMGRFKCNKSARFEEGLSTEVVINNDNLKDIQNNIKY